MLRAATHIINRPTAVQTDPPVNLLVSTLNKRLGTGKCSDIVLLALI